MSQDRGGYPMQDTLGHGHAPQYDDYYGDEYGGYPEQVGLLRPSVWLSIFSPDHPFLIALNFNAMIS
jgi:hypothetical protein